MFGLFKAKQPKPDLLSEVESLRQELTAVKNEYQAWGGLSGEEWSEFFSSARTASGAIVTPETAKQSSALTACIRLIAGSVALLPIPVYERIDDHRVQVEHDIWWLLNESPHPTLTACSFWEWMVQSMFMRGDGIAQILRDRRGGITGFHPLARENVVIKRVDDRLIYLVNDAEKKYGLTQDDVLHFPGFGFDGVQGESIIRYAARQSIGTSLAADEFAGEFFANGAQPTVVIGYPEGVAPKKEQADLLREQIEERHTGRGQRHKPLVLTNGGKLTPVSWSAEDAQLLETRRFQILEIARVLGVPGHMIGESSAASTWGSGIEQLAIAFNKFTLGSHLRRFEQELNRKLWPRSYRYFVEFDRDGLLAGDSKTEAEVFSKALGGPGNQGYMVVNEVRRKKNLPPLPGGDVMVFVNQTTKVKPNESNAAAD